jgi:hypothetical protein
MFTVLWISRSTGMPIKYWSGPYDTMEQALATTPMRDGHIQFKWIVKGEYISPYASKKI